MGIKEVVAPIVGEASRLEALSRGVGRPQSAEAVALDEAARALRQMAKGLGLFREKAEELLGCIKQETREIIVRKEDGFPILLELVPELATGDEGTSEKTGASDEPPAGEPEGEKSGSPDEPPAAKPEDEKTGAPDEPPAGKPEDGKTGAPDEPGTSGQPENANPPEGPGTSGDPEDADPPEKAGTSEKPDGGPAE